MNKHIKLTAIHAINWLGYCETIPLFGDVSVLTGRNGSGKTALMDLIQTVLVGAGNAKFNQSATGKASSRTFKSYCLGEIYSEDGSPSYMRAGGSITYIALQFEWETGRVETWGIRSEFDSAASAHPHNTGFVIPSKLNRSSWLEPNRKPKSIQDFRAMVKEMGGRTFDTLGEYLSEMALPGNLNFDRSRINSLLPTAMSFTFMPSFNAFCRQFILPSSEVDVSATRESYIAFRGMRETVRALSDQAERLKNIKSLHADVESKAVEGQLLRLLAASWRLEIVSEKLETQRTELEALRAGNQAAIEARANIESSIFDLRTERDQIRERIAGIQDGGTYLALKEVNRSRAAKLERARETGVAVRSAIASRVTAARAWVQKARSDAAAVMSSEFGKEGVEAILRAAQALEDDRAGHSDAAAKLAESFREIEKRLDRVHSAIGSELAALRLQASALGGDIESLKRGVVKGNDRLLSFLNNHPDLTKDGATPAFALHQLCEVVDEEWRPAIEIAFARKFAIVLSGDGERFNVAARLFHEFQDASRGESLIDAEAALKLPGKTRSGSLAEKIQTDNPVAKAIIAHQFGNLMCVDRVEELRKHDRAIMRDGFSYQRPFTERRGKYDNMPVIGSKGRDKRAAFLRQELDRVNAEIALVEGRQTAVGAMVSMIVAGSLNRDTIHDQAHVLDEIVTLENDLSDGIRRLQAVESPELEPLSIRSTEIEGEISTLERKRTEMDSRKGSDEFRVQALEQEMEGLESGVANRRQQLSRVQSECGDDVAAMADRMNSLRASLLSENGDPEAAAEIANDRGFSLMSESSNAMAVVVAARKELAMTHAAYRDLDEQSRDNRDYDEHLERISAVDLPSYTERARSEEENWRGLFRTHVLSRIAANLQISEALVTRLSNQLRETPIGGKIYQIRRTVNRDSEYETFRMLMEMDSGEESSSGDDTAEATERAERVFDMLVEAPDGAEATKFLDYRLYHDYDLIVKDQSAPHNASGISMNRNSSKFSGGENQAPFFVAILACYLQAYLRYDDQNKQESLALVPIDEAFSKLTGRNLSDCVKAIRALGLQAFFSMTDGNSAHALDFCDQIMIVTKTGGNSRHVNAVESLSREDAANAA